LAKKLIIILVLSVILQINIKFAYSENITDFKELSIGASNYGLNGDVLFRFNSVSRIKLYDKVACISIDRNALYYIRYSDNKLLAGILKENQGKVTEFEIPGRYGRLYKLAVYNNIFYFLAEPVSETAGVKAETIPLLVRFNPDQSALQSIEGVIDFILIDGKTVLLKKNFLDSNGLSIPLMISGNLKISDVTDSRIVTISGSDGTEIVDILAEKSIYQYRNNSVTSNPEEYNVILEFEDKIAKTDLETGIESGIYYEIFIDGLPDNRTETGRGDLSKTFHSRLVPGKYHFIKPERWELDKVKGRYVRMNNIYQPSEIKVFIPENRILKIKLVFDGAVYNINSSVLYK